MTKRYNIQNNTWEIGYYQGTRFIIVNIISIDNQ